MFIQILFLKSRNNPDEAKHLPTKFIRKSPANLNVVCPALHKLTGTRSKSVST